MAPERLGKFVYAAAGLCALVGIFLWLTSDGAVAARERAAYAEVAAAAESAEPASDAPATVESVRVELRAFAVRADLSAVLQPLRRVEVGSEVQGRVLEVPAQEYSQVEAEATLVQVEAKRYAAALDRASAAEARARANHKLAQLDLERQRGLRAQNVASEAEFDRASSGERARRADLKEARATLADAELDLDRTAIRSPFAGTVSRLKLEPGSYIRPGDFVAEIVDLSQIELEVGVTDRQIVVLRPGMPVELSVDVFPGERFAGKVEHVGRTADRESRKFTVEVHVPNPDGRLLSGMLGTVHFVSDSLAPQIRLPRRAIGKEYELNYVFVIVGPSSEGDQGGELRLEKRRIVTSPVAFQADTVQVISGLEAGERVAVGDVGQLQDGDAVRVRENRP